jgi:ATP-binding cassette, subfamily C, bacterial CydCD
VPALRDGRISGATVAVLAFLGLGVGETMSGLSEAAAHLTGSLAGARRVAALAEQAPAVLGPPETEAVGPIPVPHGPGGAPPRLALSAVTLTWPGGTRPALCGLDLDIAPGEAVAVVGPSGAGKSTLGHVLLRFASPDTGCVTLDGVDVALLDPEAVRALIAWAPQDPHIFGTSVAANLRLAAPDAPDERLRSELDRVGLAGWLAGLPNGLDTILGERGATVSGGEAQRIGIARALLADRPVLLLDEPTAHLDEPLAADLERRVLEAAKGRSMLWITHRMAGLGAFDDVVALVDGHRVDGSRVDGSRVAGRRVDGRRTDPGRRASWSPVPGPAPAGSGPRG